MCCTTPKAVPARGSRMRRKCDRRNSTWYRILLIGAAVALCTIADRAQSKLAAREDSSQDPWIREHINELLSIYTHLHRHPELSYQENETAHLLSLELRKTGAEVTTGVGKLGVVGILKNGPGPVVLVRTDMDALPVVEETELPYRSHA